MPDGFAEIMLAGEYGPANDLLMDHDHPAAGFDHTRVSHDSYGDLHDTGPVNSGGRNVPYVFQGKVKGRMSRGSNGDWLAHAYAPDGIHLWRLPMKRSAVGRALEKARSVFRPIGMARPLDPIASGYVSSSQRPYSTFREAKANYGVGPHAALPGDPALGVWLDGAEESAHIHGTRAQVERKTLVAGLRNAQKAVAFFYPDHTGPDARHTIVFAGARDPEILHAAGRTQGFDGATFIPREHGTEAHYLDVGNKQAAQAAALAQAFGGELRSEPGHVDFVGGDTREEAKKIFAQRLLNRTKVLPPEG